MQAGERPPPPSAPPPSADAKPPAEDEENKDVVKPSERAPFCMVHDFGKVQRGTILQHSFRIRNVSDVPLQMVSLRIS
jgi:hypothetical protein